MIVGFIWLARYSSSLAPISPRSLKYTIIFMVFVNWRIVYGNIKNRSIKCQATAIERQQQQHTVAQIITNSENNCKIFKKSFDARACAINIRGKITERERKRQRALVKSNEKHYQQCWQHPATINSLASALSRSFALFVASVLTFKRFKQYASVCVPLIDSQLNGTTTTKNWALSL